MKAKRVIYNYKETEPKLRRGFGKAAAAAVTITVLLLACLFALSFSAGGKGFRSLLLAVPLNVAAPGLDPTRLEDFIEEEFLLTYEIPKQAGAQAVNQRHTVTVTGTNSHYAGLLGYVNLDGGFFTESAMDTKQKHAVLNETAAFLIFGGVRVTGQSVKLDGERWIVTGVISDGDSNNANIYVPASITGGQARSIMVLLDGAVSEAHAKNALKRIGVNDNSFDFINLSKSAGIFEECFAVTIKAALFALLLAFAVRAAGWLTGRFRFFRTQLDKLYLRELVARYRTEFFKILIVAVLFTGGVAAMLLLSMQILETCLTWQEATWITGELTVGNFGTRLIWLRDMQPLCFLLFTACIAGIAASLTLYLLRQSGQRAANPIYFFFCFANVLNCM